MWQLVELSTKTSVVNRDKTILKIRIIHSNQMFDKIMIVKEIEEIAFKSAPLIGVYFFGMDERYLCHFFVKKTFEIFL